jgi:hypothetical protein
MDQLTSIARGIGLLAAACVLAIACGDGDGQVTAPTLEIAQEGGSSRAVYDANLFFAATGVNRSSFPRYGAENSYDIFLGGFVGNTNPIAVSDVRVMVQLFDASSEQIGVQIVRTVPGSLAAGKFSQYLVRFGPFRDPSYVSWYRVTPYNSRGKGLVLEQSLGL